MLHDEVYHEVHMDLQIAGLCTECGEKPALDAIETCQSCLDAWAEANAPEDEILDDFPTELDNFGIAEGEAEAYIEAEMLQIARKQAFMAKAEKAFHEEVRVTTYRCQSDKCQSCGSTRNTRGIGQYQIEGDTQTLISCSDCHL